MARGAQGPVAFACDCGSLSGHITAKGVKSGTHVVCYCPDCRAGELYFDQPDPAPGPVDIFQMSPDAVVIEKGAEHLALMRLSPKGLFRWYAKCCNAPIATTMRSVKLPFAGFNVRRIAEPERLGPVVAKGFIQTESGHKHENFGRAAFSLLGRLISARISGRWRNTPFFNSETGEPVAEARILSKEERAALYR